MLVERRDGEPARGRFERERGASGHGRGVAPEGPVGHEPGTFEAGSLAGQRIGGLRVDAGPEAVAGVPWQEAAFDTRARERARAVLTGGAGGARDEAAACERITGPDPTAERRGIVGAHRTPGARLAHAATAGIAERAQVAVITREAFGRGFEHAAPRATRPGLTLRGDRLIRAVRREPALRSLDDLDVLGGNDLAVGDARIARVRRSECVSRDVGVGSLVGVHIVTRVRDLGHRDAGVVDLDEVGSVDVVAHVGAARVGDVDRFDLGIGDIRGHDVVCVVDLDDGAVANLTFDGLAGRRVVDAHVDHGTRVRLDAGAEHNGERCSDGGHTGRGEDTELVSDHLTPR